MGPRWTSAWRTPRATTFAELPAEQFPNLRAVAEHFGQGDNDQSFELLIDLFVDGLAQHVRAYAEKPKPRPETTADPERSAR